MKKPAPDAVQMLSMQLKAGAEAMEVLSAIQSLIDELLDNRQAMVAHSLEMEQDWVNRLVGEGLDRIH